MRARAPGKMILSGEHAVAYGADALAIAVQQYTTIEFTPSNIDNCLNTQFAGVDAGASYSLDALDALKHELDLRYEAFVNGDQPIQSVLTNPNDLAIYTISTLVNHISNRQTQLNPKSGLLHTQSNIPTGAGMGSSASAIAATLALYETLLDKPLTVDQRFDYVRFCERLQHGKGSAIDAACVTFGGANVLRDRKRISTDICLDQHWYWLHAGKPQTGTGECVAFVREHYGKDQPRWDAFTATTRAMEKALQVGDNPSDMIRENHRLLQTIGVVPAKASALIADIEAIGGNAKISGAGAIAGDAGGLVLMYLPMQTAQVEAEITRLNEKHHGYIQSWGSVHMAEHGAHRLDDAAGEA